MLFNFRKCKCIQTEHEDAQYAMGSTVLNTTLKENNLGLTANLTCRYQSSVELQKRR